MALARSQGKPAPPSMSIPARKHLLFRPLLPLLGHLNRTTAAVARHYNLRLPPPTPARLSLTNPILSKLESCAPDLAHFKQIHAQAVATGLCHDAFAASRLVKFLTCRLETPDLRRAALLLSQVQHPDVFVYNLLFQAFSRSSTPLQSFDFYRDLLCQGLRPNGYSLCFLLACCARGLALREGRQVHGHLCKMGLDFETYAGTSLVHMYGECGDLGNAVQSFDGMPHRTGVSWSAMVGAYATCGYLVEALRLFREIVIACVEVTNTAAVSALCACAKLGDLVLGRMVHAHIAVKGFDLNVTLGTSLVDMYSKCGAMDAAAEIFSAMPVVTVGSWNCMINGLAMNGDGNEAIDTFREMQRSGVQPNGVTLLGVLSACSHSGLVEAGAEYFSQMTRQYGLVPNLKHYGCMVDLYGRAGHIQEALDTIRTMPMEPDVVIWGTLFGASRTQGHALLGELVGAQLVKVVPHDTSGYLLLSDAYASTRRWDDVAGVRKMMAEMNMRKEEPGYSSVANWAPGKCGQPRKAKRSLQHPEKDTATTLPLYWRKQPSPFS